MALCNTDITSSISYSYFTYVQNITLIHMLKISEHWLEIWYENNPISLEIMANNDLQSNVRCKYRMNRQLYTLFSLKCQIKYLYITIYNFQDHVVQYISYKHSSGHSMIISTYLNKCSIFIRQSKLAKILHWRNRRKGNPEIWHGTKFFINFRVNFYINTQPLVLISILLRPLKNLNKIHGLINCKSIHDLHSWHTFVDALSNVASKMS